MTTLIIFVLVFGSTCVKLARPESREASKLVSVSLVILVAAMFMGLVTIGGH